MSTRADWAKAKLSNLHFPHHRPQEDSEEDSEEEDNGTPLTPPFSPMGFFSLSQSSEPEP